MIVEKRRSVDQIIRFGARVWHPTGCPHCPESQAFHLGELIGQQRWGGRPEDVVCPFCRMSLIPDLGRWVYFVAVSSGEVKIGTAVNLRSRIGGLQVGHPHPLHVVALTDGSGDVETQLHDRFAEHRIRGEWFYPADELTSYMHSRIVVDLPFFEFCDALKRSER